MISGISCCGIVCSDCPEHRCGCTGCRAAEGKPPWLGEAGLEMCPLYRCAVHGREFKNCGECFELPCARFFELKDPVLSDGEFKKSVEDRVLLLRMLYYS